MQTIIKCSEYEYLIIVDWSKLISSKISCPNQATLFEQSPPYIYDYQAGPNTCDEKSQTFSIYLNAFILWPEKNKYNSLSDDKLKLLSTTISMNNISYPFEATKTEDRDKILINEVIVRWSSNNTYFFYTIFNEQPTICRIELKLAKQVKSGKCIDTTGSYITLCFSDVLSKLPMQNVNWILLDKFLQDGTYSPRNWRDKGGYYLDLRLLKTTTTTTTTTTITTTKKTSTTTTSTTTTTTPTTTSTTVTTTKMTTTTTSTITTTTKTTTTKTTTTTTSTTTLSSKSTSILDSTWITTTPVETDTTPTMPTPTETSMITSSAIHSTNLDHILTIDMEIATRVLLNASTTRKKIVKTTSKLPMKHSTSTKASKKMKPPKNNSVVFQKPSSKKSSSSRSILFVLLLIFFIFCIIGSVLFFVFRYQHNRQDDDQSHLNRDRSEESYNSNMNESEIDSSTDGREELSETGKTRKGGRLFNQLDPDAL